MSSIKKLIGNKLTREEYLSGQYELYVRDYKKKFRRMDAISSMLSKDEYLTVVELQPDLDFKKIINRQFYSIERSTAMKISKQLGLNGYKDIWMKGVDISMRNELKGVYNDLIMKGMSSKEAAAMTYDIWYADSP